MLDIPTREGSLTGDNFRVRASASNAGLTGEGPLGGKKRGSWMVAARKSYLQYIFQRTFPDTSFIFGFEDVQGRLSYDLTPKNNITLYVLESYSALNRDVTPSWVSTRSHRRLSLHSRQSRLALLAQREAADCQPRRLDAREVRRLQPHATAAGGGLLRRVGLEYEHHLDVEKQTPLDAGWSLRRLRNNGFANQYQTGSPLPRLLDHSDGTALREGGYAQQSWMPWAGRLHFTAGVRWDHHSVDHVGGGFPASLRIAGPDRGHAHSTRLRTVRAISRNHAP